MPVTIVSWHAGGVTESRNWLTIPDVGERLGLPPGKVHRLIEEHALLAVRRDGVLRVPEDFLDDEGPVRDLRGTVVVLHDAGYTDDEALEWLLGEDDTLGAAPIDALRAGRRAEVRRVAQSLAF